jgi:hypothetical protein
MVVETEIAMPEFAIGQDREPVPSMLRSQISLTSNVMLSSQLFKGLLSSFLSTGFHTKIFYEFLVSPIRGLCSAHHNLLNSISLTKRAGIPVYTVQSSLIFSKIYRMVTVFELNNNGTYQEFILLLISSSTFYVLLFNNTEYLPYKPEYKATPYFSNEKIRKKFF